MGGSGSKGSAKANEPRPARERDDVYPINRQVSTGNVRTYLPITL